MLLQFTKVVNDFYVVNAILQSMPAVSVNSPWATIIPLAYVILIGMLKEAIADYKRYKQDKKSNSTLCRIVSQIGHPASQRVRSDAVRVGDVLEIHDGEVVPADCLLLNANSDSGECYIETRSLDGETNLKPKLAIRNVNEYFSGRKSDDIGVLHVQCQPPNANLYQFSAVASWKGGRYEADLKQFLPRGSHLRNSNKVTVLVLFTSTDCKLVMNEGSYKFKQSQLDRNINYLMAWNIFQMLTIAALMTWICYHFLIKNYTTDTYLFEASPSIRSLTISAYGSYFLLLNQFVPLELVLTIEMIKIFVVSFIENDVHMSYGDPAEPTGELLYCRAQNLNLHEDLGQIDYLFCDKTGTLTQNELRFMAWSCGGHVVNEQYQPTERFKQMLRTICLCHDALTISVEADDGSSSLHLSGPSQDELCLLEMVAANGLAKFKSKDSHQIIIEVLG